MVTTFCTVYTKAPEEIVNSMADNMRTIITDTKVDVDINYDETILVDGTKDITTTDDVCKLAKYIARVSCGYSFKLDGYIDEYSEMEQKFRFIFDGKQLSVSFTPRYMFIPQKSIDSYSKFCRYICWIDEEDFEKLAYQDLYLIDGLEPADSVEFEEPIILEWH